MHDIIDLAVDQIDPSPYQQRRKFSERALRELGTNIVRDGQTQEIVVRRAASDRFELIVGERRCRAIRDYTPATTVRARVIEATDLQARRMGAAENMQREKLVPMEIVEALVELIDAELIDDPEYAALGDVPVARVTALLKKLDAGQGRSGGTQETPKGQEAVIFFHKFVEKVETLFATLPQSKQWRSFLMHDLPLLRDTALEVQDVAVANDLKPTQIEALQALWTEQREMYEAILAGTDEEGVTTVAADLIPTVKKGKKKGLAAIPLHDVSGRELDAVRLEAEQRARKAEQLRQAEETEAVLEGQVQIEPRTQPGDWWQLGPHLLYCGDTANAAFIEALPMAKLAFADPPYNAHVAQWDSRFIWDHDYLHSLAELVTVTPGGERIFDFARETNMPYQGPLYCYIENGMARGFVAFSLVIFVAVFAAERSLCFRQGMQDLCRTTVDNSETLVTEHKGRKPAKLLTWLMQSFGEPGDTVIDPFLGSGTTLFAAQAAGWLCVGGEIRPEACDEILSRWDTLAADQGLPLAVRVEKHETPGEPGMVRAPRRSGLPIAPEETVPSVQTVEA